MAYPVNTSTVSLPKLHGLPLMQDGMAGHALSPQMRNVPGGNYSGESLDQEIKVIVTPGTFVFIDWMMLGNIPQCIWLFSYSIGINDSI